MSQFLCASPFERATAAGSVKASPLVPPMRFARAVFPLGCTFVFSIQSLDGHGKFVEFDAKVRDVLIRVTFVPATPLALLAYGRVASVPRRYPGQQAPICRGGQGWHWGWISRWGAPP